MGSICFPNMGIEISPAKSFSLFGIDIAFYGVLIAIGIVLGALLAYKEARRTGQKVDNYIDFTIFGLIGALVCARLYYVIFSWDYYSQHPGDIFNIRQGGLAIYGAVIGAIIVLIVFAKVKKVRFWQYMDTMVFGFYVGQAIGRWGNFFNRECYGSFKFNFLGTGFDVGDVGFFKWLTMRIPVTDVNVVTDEIVKEIDGTMYVEVLPTFLLESVLLVVFLILALVFRDRKKFYGENFCRYCVGYGLVRFFIEGFRLDQLTTSDGTVAVSQVLSLIMVVGGLFTIFFMRIKFRNKTLVDPIPTKEEVVALNAKWKEEDELKKKERLEKKAAKKAAKTEAEVKIEAENEVETESKADLEK